MNIVRKIVLGVVTVGAVGAGVMGLSSPAHADTSWGWSISDTSWGW